MKLSRLVLGFILCGWSAWASLPGDVNGDEAVNVADLVRAQKIADGELAFEAAADIDGDSVVTEVDVFLIREAVLGRPIPEIVDSASIGSSGGSLSDGDISMDFPTGSIGTHHLTLLRCVATDLDDETSLHAVYMVCGLSTNLAGLSVSYANCSNDTGLAVGSYLQPYDEGEMRWDWRALPGSEFVRNGTQISRSFLDPGASDFAISHSLKFALVSADAPPPVTQAQLIAVAADAPVQAASVPGHRYAGYLYTGWISDRFHVYTKDWGTVKYSDLETVCGDLYSAYAKIKAMGFPLDTTDASIFPLDVYVVRGLGNDGGSVNNPVTGSHWLELNAGLLTVPVELNSTIGHELMHYVLKEYNHGDAFAFESTEDAITTWFETVASATPSHLSGNYGERPAAVLKGLFVPITRSWGFRNWSAQEQHGYGASAFVDYCFDTHQEWIYELALGVKGGKTIERALDDLFITHDGPLSQLEDRYLEFVRDYLMIEPDTYSFTDLFNPVSIFKNDAKTDLSGMYKLVSIKKASTNLLEKQEVALKVQDYGCGVVQFKILKPDRIFAPHTKLRVTAPKICKSIDLLLYYKDTSRVSHSEIVKGVFGPNPQGENEWSCAIDLPKDANGIILSALAVMGNEGDPSDYTEEHDIALTYQFVGDYYMPMQESFISYTELSTRMTYYFAQIYCDAIFRIVDPSNTAGLENFTVHRYSVGSSHPNENYSTRQALSWSGGTRKTVDAFQIRLFSDATVPDLPPYTINYTTSGSSYYTDDGQTPVMAADGSPQMELMVYYYPPSAYEQIVLGEPAYRTQHLITSVYELQQSEDGDSGGILVDIPAQIADYTCVVYLFNCEDGESLGHTAFIADIFPKEEEE